MDWQQVLPWLGPFVGTILIAYVRSAKAKADREREDMTKAITATADKLTAFQLEVAKEYVTHLDLREIKDSLIRIEATLAEKANR